MTQQFDFSAPPGVNLNTLLSAKLQEYTASLHTAMVGEVVEYNAEDGTATIQPHQMRHFVGQESPVALPILNKVPILFQRTAKSWIRLPIAKGDLVLLVFSERSLDNWLTGTGSPTYHDDARRFSLNDAVAIPGVYPFSKPVTAFGKATSLEVSNGSSFIEVEESGSIKAVASKGGAFLEISPQGKMRAGTSENELVTILSSLIDALISAETQTSIGLQKFFATTLKALGEIKTKVDTLKM